MSGAPIGTGYSRTFDARHTANPCPKNAFQRGVNTTLTSFEYPEGTWNSPAPNSH